MDRLPALELGYLLPTLYLFFLKSLFYLCINDIIKGMRKILSLLFIPQESNNHRAKILHHASLLLLIVILLFATFFVRNFSNVFPSVLGISADITSDDLLSLTNVKRQENGVSPLVSNAKLSEAAVQKANDMFELGYWAHNSPDGKTPWVFIKNSGYNYVYAGENLARGFTSAEDVVKAWMDSPTHRANMLSSNYKDVGFAVKIGSLNGEETVLIVEELGNEFAPIAEKKNVKIEVSSSQAKTLADNTPVLNKPLINSLSLSSGINKIIVAIFIFALILDMIVIERKKIFRFVGHNIDHVLYLLLIFVLIGILSKGVII